MDQARARELLAEERARLERLLAADPGGAAPDGAAEGVGDEVDNADRRVTEETGAAVSQLVRDRWEALQRAERRLADGTYGRSVRSGEPIPDERLEADPLAELTVQEAAGEPGAGEESEEAYGLRSARYPYQVRDDEDITPEEAIADEEGDDEPPPEQPNGIHVERDGAG
jgi:DnaK suppressor protein